MESRPMINTRNKLGEGIVALAVESQNIEILKYVLLNGADRNVADYEGRAPMDLALKMNNAEIQELLKRP